MGYVGQVETMGDAWSDFQIDIPQSWRVIIFLSFYNFLLLVVSKNLCQKNGWPQRRGKAPSAKGGHIYLII